MSRELYPRKVVSYEIPCPAFEDDYPDNTWVEQKNCSICNHCLSYTPKGKVICNFKKEGEPRV